MDLLIRDIPDEVMAALDDQARKAGLSRTEYLRRRLLGDAQRLAAAVTPEGLRDLGRRISDLADEHVVKQAWQ